MRGAMNPVPEDSTVAETKNNQAAIEKLQASYDAAVGNIAVDLPGVPQDQSLNPLLSSVFQGMNRAIDYFTRSNGPR